MSLDRRQAMAALSALLPLAIATQATAETPSLGSVAAAAGLLFGTAIDREILADGPYRRLVAQQARILSTENTLKFDWLRPQGPEADFTQADLLVEFAAKNALALRGHTLIWNDNPPPWLARFGSGEVATMLDRHIDETVGRYRGRMHSWDVVNEPFYPPQGMRGGWRKGPWFAALGEAYVERAFRRAAAADPSTRLVLNEAFCEQQDGLGSGVREGLLKLVSRLKDGGVPLHAVGLQGHLKPSLPYDDQAFVGFLHQLAALKVDIYITELDVDDSAMSDDISRRDQMVAKRYSDFLRAILTVPAVKLVMTWQLSDRFSWLGDLARKRNPAGRSPRPLPFDADFSEKPAVRAIKEAFLTRIK